MYYKFNFVFSSPITLLTLLFSGVLAGIAVSSFKLAVMFLFVLDLFEAEDGEEEEEEEEETLAKYE